MDIASLIGVIASFGFVIYGYAMDGAAFPGLIMLSAAIITCGGTLGAVMLSFGFDNLKNFPKLTIEAFKGRNHKLTKNRLLISLARTAKAKRNAQP